MFKLLTSLLLTVAINSLAQEKLMDILPLSDGIVTYSEVIQVDSISKDALYAKAKKWFVNAYKSANDVIQLEDKEKGEITGKGLFKINYYTRNPSINHTVSIAVKDGRYRYVITDFSYSDNQGEKFTIENFPKMWAGKKKLYNTVNEEASSLAASIKKHMGIVEKDNW